MDEQVSKKDQELLIAGKYFDDMCRNLHAMMATDSFYILLRWHNGKIFLVAAGQRPHEGVIWPQDENIIPPKQPEYTG